MIITQETVRRTEPRTVVITIGDLLRTVVVDVLVLALPTKPQRNVLDPDRGESNAREAMKGQGPQ